MSDENNEVAVVLHFRGGRTLTARLQEDVDAAGESLSVATDEGHLDVHFDQLKAIFFLRDRISDGDSPGAAQGSVLTVEFDDGEVMRGRSAAYNPGRAGFFLYPIERSKNERVFVISSAVVSIDVEKL